MMIFHCRMLDCSLRYASFTASHSPCLFFSYPLLPYTRYCKKFRKLHFCNPFDCFAISGPYGYLAKLRLDGSFSSVISDAHVRATMSASQPCATHIHIYNDTQKMMGCCATPDCQNKIIFPLENYFVSSISPRLFCLRQCYCIALNKIKRRLSFDSLRYARRQVSSLYGFDDGGLFIASLIA